MKSTILSLLLVLFLAPVFSFSQTLETDARFNLVKKTYTLNPDGSVSQRVVKECKLFTYNSFHRLYGETFILFNPRFQTLKINSCYTIMADGKKVKAPENAFNEVLPRFAANAPAFNHLREMVVTHTGLEVGATIVLDYEIISKKEFFPYLMGQEVLAETVPVDEFQLSMIVPKDQVFNYRLYNAAVETKISTNDKSKTYSWTFRNLNSMMPEPNLPAESRYLPVIRYTTFKDMQDAIRFLTKQDAFQFVMPDDLKSGIDALKKDNPDLLQAALKIQDKVVNDYQLYPVPLSLAGFQVSTPLTVHREAGGTALEKACLMAAMLKHLGLASAVVGVQDAYYDKGTGDVGNFGQYLVQTLIPGGKAIFLSVLHTDTYDQALALGGKTLVFMEAGKDLKAETLKPVESETELKAKLKLDAEGSLSGVVELDLAGASNPYFDLKSDVSKAKSLLKALPGKTEIKDTPKIEAGGSQLTFSLQAGDKVKKNGSFFSLEIPWISNGLYSRNLGELTTDRKHPIDISVPHSEEADIEIELSAGMKMAGNPVNISLKNQAGELRIQIKQEGNKLIIKKEIELNVSVLSPDFYKQLRELTSIWYSKSNREILLNLEI